MLFQYVVSGANFNMTCLLLAIQSMVCIAVVRMTKAIGVIEFQDFDMTAAKKWFPISFMLASVIYTGSKSLVRTRNGTGLSSGVLIMPFSNTSVSLYSPSSRT